MIPTKDEKENKDEFNVEVNEKDSQQKTIIDLNKIFHIDLSYNFDLLKNLLSTIITNQKSKDDKILDLESQILNLKILLGDTLNEPESTKKFQDTKTKLSSFLYRGKDFPDTTCLSYIITPPKNISLETSPKNDPLINQIIVSSNNILIIKYFHISFFDV
jgi:hypothetical protein